MDSIVYLSESGSHRVNFANIFADLSKLLTVETASLLDVTYKNPQISTSAKMSALLDQFAATKVILLLDNLESLINVETFGIGDSELDEGLCTFLRGAHSALKIILTTRIAPRGLNLCEPGRQRVLRLDEGLESPYAENILREMDSDGKLGLRNAPDKLLAHAREHTRGYPRALEAPFAILSSDRYTSLEEILTTAENYLPDYVVQSLVGEAFSRLDSNAQKVMQALAIYNRPVTTGAVDYILAQHLPGIDSAPVLNRLVTMQFVRRESGRYYLHPVDQEFAISRIPVEVSEMGWDQKSLTVHAADYFAQARKPRAEWKKLDDLAAQLAEFELRCAAGDYDTAASVLTDIDFDYLHLWGNYRLLIDLHLRVKDKLQDKKLLMNNMNALGLTYSAIGQDKEAIVYYETGLHIARETNDRPYEESFLGNIGTTYYFLGNARKAQEFYEQALVIDREVGDRRGESDDLAGLGNIHSALGEIYKAQEFYGQALIIAREIGDQRREGTELSNLASVSSSLAEYDKAIGYYYQALQNAEETGNEYGKSKRLNGLANVNIEKGDLQNAIKNAQESIQIGQEISSLEVCIESSHTLAIAHILSENLKEAMQVIRDAEKYNQPHYHFNISTLHGIIALRQGERETAQEAFAKSIAQADEILAKTPDYYSALDAKGLALCGVILAGRGDPSMPQGANAGKTAPPDKSTVSNGWVAPTINNAIETFRAARKIAPHAGVVKSVLRLFDELAKCDEEGILKDVRKAVEG